MERRLSATVLAFVVVFAGCSFRLDRALEAGDVRGSVVFESASGERSAAAGAKVVVVGVPGAAIADARGRFVFRGLPPSTHLLRITYDQGADGSIDGAVQLRVNLPATGDGRAGGLDLGEQVVAAFGGLVGTVTQGRPVDGAQVVVGFTGATRTVGGAYAFENLPAGDYEVAVAIDGAGTTKVSPPTTVTIRARETTTLDLDLEALTLAAFGNASGEAYLAGQRTHDGIAIKLVGTSGGALDAAETASDGLWAAATLPAGVYTLLAESTDYATSAVPFVVVSGDVTVPPVTLAPASHPCGLGDETFDPADPDGDGVTDEPEACRCDPDGHLDANTNGVCDDLESSGGGGGTTLHLLTSSPSHLDEAVLLDAPLTVTFDAALDDATVNASTVLVTAGGRTIAGDFSVNSDTFTFTPTAGWPPESTVDVVVSTAVVGATGEALAAAETISFKTGGDVLFVDARNDTACAIRSPGTLWCWGAGDTAQLGDGGEVGSPKPLQVGFAADWTDVAVGYDVTLGLRGADLYSWGEDFHGALGQGDRGISLLPVRVGLPGAWKDVAAGDNHACAVRLDGTLWCWGRDNRGQVGNGASNTADVTTPMPVAAGPFRSVSASADTTCAIHQDGSLWCWGRNSTGEAGIASPATIDVPTQVEAGPGWTDVSVTTGVGCGVRAGELWCWGTGAQPSQLLASPSAVPTKVPGISGATAVDVGEGHACVVANAVLSCWGANWAGQLGDGGTSIRTTLQPVAGGDAWSQVSILADATCALQESGRLRCFGADWDGEGGSGHGGETRFPFDTKNTIRFIDHAIGGRRNCAISEDHALFCASGGSGDADTDGTWIRVGSATDWLRVFSGGQIVCGLRGRANDTEGALWCLGGSFGGLAAVDANTDWVFADTADTHACGLRANGSLWCWGENARGVLFDGTETAHASPVDVSNGAQWDDVGTHENATCAIRHDGAMLCAGIHVFPTLTTTPTLVGSDTTWKRLAMGRFHQCALDSTGTALCWGANAEGESGIGSSGTTLTSPTPVATARKFTDLVAGGIATCGLQADGQYVCWGRGNQAGIGGGRYGVLPTPLPLDDVDALDFGDETACARLGTSLWCWGKDDGSFGAGWNERPDPMPVAFEAACQNDVFEPDPTPNASRGFSLNSQSTRSTDGRLCTDDTDHRVMELPGEAGTLVTWVANTVGDATLTAWILDESARTELVTTTVAPGAQGRLITTVGTEISQHLKVRADGLAQWTADQHFIPAVCDDDVYEPNDIDQPTLLAAPPPAPSMGGRNDRLTLCGNDEDWFRAGVKSFSPALFRLTHVLPREAVQVDFLDLFGAPITDGLTVVPHSDDDDNRSEARYSWTVTSTTDREVLVRIKLSATAGVPSLPYEFYTMR